MKAEIISAGTELLLGHTINTDAAILARILAEQGIDLLHVSVVGDNAQRLRAAIAEAMQRCDLLFTTGGLGPTSDDLTKEVVAQYANLPLVEDEASFKRLQEYFVGRHMSANQRKQAFLPLGATVLKNDMGTAPGCIVHLRGKHIILLPGPPRELSPMLENYVIPFLKQLSNASIHSTIVRTWGIGEGDAAELLDDLLQGANPTAATYAANDEMFIKVTAKASDKDSAVKLANPLVDKIRSRLGNVVYGIDVPSLEYVVTRKLIEDNISIATAESCTGGLLAKRITDQPGVSSIFGLGLVTYSNIAKENILKIPSDMLSKWGAVSEQVAREMAKNVKEIAKSHLGVGITGIAGPDGGSAEKPVGLVYIALAFPNGCWLRVMQPQGIYLGREWIRNRAASNALDMVRRHIYGLPCEDKEN